MSLLPYEVIDTSNTVRNKDYKNTVHYSTSVNNLGKSLSRITIYHSGANRIRRKPETTPPANELKRHKYDITSFSYPARSRYFNYTNSLPLEDYQTFILTMTITSHFFDFLTLDNFRLLCKKFYRYLINEGYDYVYKLEFTLGKTYSSTGMENVLSLYTPMPHLHIIIYSKDKIEFSEFYSADHKRLEFSKVWTDYCFDSLGIRFWADFDFAFMDDYKNMLSQSCYLEIPQDIKCKIFYLSYYFTKDKEYQNIIPEKFRGLKMWGYGRENYGDIKKETVEIDITQEIYDRIFLQAQDLALKKKRSECKFEDKNLYKDCYCCPRLDRCIMYKKNGIYYKEIFELLNALKNNGSFDTMLFNT